jgi:hypothetical protein
MKCIHVLWKPLKIRRSRGFSAVDGALKIARYVNNIFRWTPERAFIRLAGISHGG